MRKTEKVRKGEGEPGDEAKKLVFVPVASALTGTHRDSLVAASIAQWSEI